MKKLSLVFLAALLLALHVSCQVAQAQGTNSTTHRPYTPTGNGCGSPAAAALLLAPLLLSTLLLHGWSG